MGTPRFRPRLEGMEDRLTPAVDPAAAAAAFAFVQASHEELGIIWQHAGDPKTTLVLNYHKDYLPKVAIVNQAMADTLAAYAAELNAAVAADPTLAAALAPIAATAAAGATSAMANVVYSEAYAIGFGVPASTYTPPPPPVSPPPAIAPDPTTPTGPITTPLNPTDASGVTTTIPDLASAEWRTTASGLRIWDVVTGSGTAFKPGDNVTVHYVGWLTDGSTFDSSVARGTPSTFSLNSVIPGWIEGIPGLQPGGLRRLDIPANLAYGPAARPGIPAYSRLIFEIKGLTPGTT